jgi:hypothetical protein
MKRKVLEEIMSKSYEDRKKLMMSKGNDYANLDILSNFKRVGIIVDTLFNPTRDFIPGKYKFVVTMIVLKLDRIINLMSKTTVSNESLIDSFDDLKNYIDLFEALLEE